MTRLNTSFACLTLFIIMVPAVFSLTLEVPSDYPTIQAAIDASSHNDTIYISNGTYIENLVITKSITLIGESRDGVIIDGSATGDVIAVNSDYVSLLEITVQNSGNFIQYQDSDSIDAAVELYKSDSCTIRDCHFTFNAAGIALRTASFNLIKDCELNDNTDGIAFHGNRFDDYEYDYNKDNIIVGNHIHENSRAVHFYHALVSYHEDNSIIGNVIVENEIGVHMIMIRGNEIAYNDFSNNSSVGTHIFLCGHGESNTTIHDNNFINNNGGEYQSFADYDGRFRNYWLHNYWSDYTGDDSDGDGFGDMPYTFPYCQEIFYSTCDLYPHMTPFLDSDNDFYFDIIDNCPVVANRDQDDADLDGIGDACDECTDTDGDGFGNPGFPATTCTLDNCPTFANPGQEDSDANGVGDICDFICADVNGDEAVDILDIIYLIDYKFKNGPTPVHAGSGDVNFDGTINILDIVYMINYKFKGGPWPYCGQ